MIKHPLQSMIDRYLEEKDITKESYDLYLIILNQYIAYLVREKITYATTEDVRSYIEGLSEKHYSTRWIYNQISAIKGFYAYLKIHQERLKLPTLYRDDITEPIKNVRINQRHPKPTLALDEAKKIILYLKENRRYIWHYRDYAIIYLMLISGLRSIEIRRAKRKDLVTTNSKILLYIQGKGRRSPDDFISITKGCMDAIDDYLNKRKDKNPYLFIAHSKPGKTPYLSRMFMNHMLKRVLRDALLDEVEITPHGLRHTTATLNLKRGGTLEETKRLLRHQDLATTMIYAHHLDPKKEDAENKIEHLILGSDDTTFSQDTPEYSIKKENVS